MAAAMALGMVKTTAEAFTVVVAVVQMELAGLIPELTPVEHRQQLCLTDIRRRLTLIQCQRSK